MSYITIKDLPEIQTIDLSGNEYIMVTDETSSVTSKFSVDSMVVYVGEHFDNTVDGKLELKVDKITGKGLSTEDFSTLEKNKLSSLENYTHPESGIPAGEYTKLTIDSLGHATAGSNPDTLLGYGITDAINSSNLGQPGGVATLDENGVINLSQIPVNILEYNTTTSFPITGEYNKIYISLDTNKLYRWTGVIYTPLGSLVNSVAGRTGSIILSKADVYLTNVDNTADINKNVFSATKLTTARTINSVSFDGTSNIIIEANDPNKVTSNASILGGTNTKLTYDSKGLVTAGTSLSSSDIPNLDADKITSGIISADRLPSYIANVQEALDSKVDDNEKGSANGVATLDANGKVTLTQIPDSVLGQLEYQGVWDFTTLPMATKKGQYWIASVSGNGYIVGDWAVWNGVSFDKVDNTDAVASVAGRTGNVVLTKTDVGLNNVDNTADSAKSVLSATKWTTPRTINGVAFDGSANITVSDSTAVKLTGDQTIAGVKTFSSNPISTATQSTATNALTRKDYVDTKAPIASPTFTGTVTLPATTSIGDISSTELGYLDGVTSNIQTQLAGKAPSSHTHAVSQVTDLGTAASRNVGTSAGNVMEVGAFGLGTSNPNTVLWNISDVYNLPSGIYKWISGDNNPSVYGSLIQVGMQGDRKAQISLDSDLPIITFSSIVGGVLTYSVNAIHTGNLLQTTGTSTEFPMSQKAATDAITAGDSTAVKLTGNQTIDGIKTFSSNIVGNITGNATTASTLQTGRTIGMSGDVTWTSASFNGAGNVTGVATLSNSGVTAGTFSKVTVDAKGRVTAGLIPTMEDIPDATFKRSVRAATTANITLSATQTIDGIAVVAGDRVLVKNQTTTSQNGIYVVNAGAWTRVLDANTSSKISSALVAVDSGTINGGKLFDNDFKTTDTLGTTAMLWNMNLDDGSLLTSGSTSIGMVKYNGTTAVAGQFDGGATTPTGATRLNYGGYFYPTYLNLTASGVETAASSHILMEKSSDGFVRRKTLANFKTEMFASPTLVTPNIGVATGTSFNSITGLASVAPTVAGAATVGTSTLTARQDHVHPAQTTISGNAGTATALQTARTINGVSFNGTANITIPATTINIITTEFLNGYSRGGLPIYGIEVNIGLMPNATVKNVAFAFNAAYTYWVDNQNSYCANSTASYPLNYAGNVGESISCFLDRTNNLIKVFTSDDKSTFNGKLLILYTK